MGPCSCVCNRWRHATLEAAYLRTATPLFTLHRWRRRTPCHVVPSVVTLRPANLLGCPSYFWPQQFCCNLITQLPSLVDHRLIEEKHLNRLKIHSRPTVIQNLKMRLHILDQLEWLHQVSTKANHGCAVLVSMLLRLGGRHFHVPVQMNPCAKVGKSPILKAVHSHLGAICSPTIVHPCVLIWSEHSEKTHSRHSLFIKN